VSESFADFLKILKELLETFYESFQKASTWSKTFKGAFMSKLSRNFRESFFRA
jgi:hypothetical protein